MRGSIYRRADQAHKQRMVGRAKTLDGLASSFAEFFIDLAARLFSGLSPRHFHFNLAERGELGLDCSEPRVDIRRAICGYLTRLRR
jgi:hypothetical protein